MDTIAPITTQTTSTLHLNPANPHVRAEITDLCRMHSRIIDATVGMPDNGPRVLWAHPQPHLLVIRAPHPVTPARLPAGYAHTVHHQPWQVPDRPGLWAMNAVVNPGRTRQTGGPTLNQPDRRRINAQPLLYTDPADQLAWLGRRIPGATLLDASPITARTMRGRHRTGHAITVRRVEVRALWQVHDPEAMLDRLNAGVGIDKTWGCGLTLWAPAGDMP